MFAEGPYRPLLDSRVISRPTSTSEAVLSTPRHGWADAQIRIKSAMLGAKPDAAVSIIPGAKYQPI
jgi:hypothetical protein